MGVTEIKCLKKPGANSYKVTYRQGNRIIVDNMQLPDLFNFVSLHEPKEFQLNTDLF